jgi:bifunctional hydroxylase/dehydrase
VDDENPRVVIVGAGPTGLMLAGELALAGIPALLVDRLAEPMQQSRALGFSARTIEEFDQRGLLPRFGTLETLPFGHFGGFFMDFTAVDNGSYGARGVHQARTEAVLTAWVGELGVEIHREHEVTGLGTDADGVTVRMRTPAGEREVRAEYVVGCDGARSTVRNLAGIGFPGTEATVEVWLADVSGPELRPRFAGERVDGGMVMVLPLGDGVNRIVAYERAMAPTGRTTPPSFTEVADRFERLTGGERVHDGEALWVSWFTDASRQAERYRAGRVFVAGDAAHVHLPIGAQGMSAGVQDAVNLGWKLAAVLKGDAPDELLDTYHSERHPVGARIVANTLVQRFLYLDGDAMQPLRDVFGELMFYPDVQRHLIGMVTGLDVRYDVGPGAHPLLGRRLPNEELVLPDRKTTNYDLLHKGRGVLLILDDTAGLSALAEPWADRLDIVRADQHDCKAPLDALLVRPDGYVAWLTPGTGDDADLTTALTRWFGPDPSSTTTSESSTSESES